MYLTNWKNTWCQLVPNFRTGIWSPHQLAWERNWLNEKWSPPADWQRLRIRKSFTASSEELCFFLVFLIWVKIPVGKHKLVVDSECERYGSWHWHHYCMCGHSSICICICIRWNDEIILFGLKRCEKYRIKIHSFIEMIKWFYSQMQLSLSLTPSSPADQIGEDCATCERIRILGPWIGIGIGQAIRDNKDWQNEAANQQELLEYLHGMHNFCEFFGIKLSEKLCLIKCKYIGGMWPSLLAITFLKH
jgi:hypothetical protein